jgi:hypothetical protein
MSPSNSTPSATSAATAPAAVPVASHETANDASWLISFSAAMVPFVAFCYGHSKGMTVRVVNAVVKSPIGAPGLLLLPFVTLGMEKSIYDTVQAAQGINPNTRPADRGGFPSGGAELPSFSLIPVQQYRTTVIPTQALPSQQPALLPRRLTILAKDVKLQEKL